MSRSRLRLVANSCVPRRPLLNGGSRSPHGNSSFGRAQRRVQLQRWVCSGDAVFRRVTLTACLIRFRPAINQSKRLRVSLFPCIAAAAASPADAEPRMANRGTRRQQLQPATAGSSSWATLTVCTCAVRIPDTLLTAGRPAALMRLERGAFRSNVGFTPPPSAFL